MLLLLIRIKPKIPPHTSAYTTPIISLSSLLVILHGFSDECMLYWYKEEVKFKKKQPLIKSNHIHTEITTALLEVRPVGLRKLRRAGCDVIPALILLKQQ